EPPAEEFRAAQPEPPRHLDRLADADAPAGLERSARPRQFDRERRSVERLAIVGPRNAERRAYLARPRTQLADVLAAAPLAHDVDAGGRLDRPHQQGAGAAADQIDAPVNAIRAVDVDTRRRPEHRPVARRRAPERVRSRIGRM